MQEGWVCPCNIYFNGHVIDVMKLVWGTLSYKVWFWKVIRQGESLIPKCPPSLPWRYFSFLLLFQTFTLCLPLTAIQSHLGVLFLLQIYHVLITAPQPTISIPFQVIPFPHIFSHSGAKLFHLPGLCHQALHTFELFSQSIFCMKCLLSPFCPSSSICSSRAQTPFS